MLFTCARVHWPSWGEMLDMGAALRAGGGVEFCFEDPPGGFEMGVPYFWNLEVKDGRDQFHAPYRVISGVLFK
jgi:hypothetical protein